MSIQKAAELVEVRAMDEYANTLLDDARHVLLSADGPQRSSYMGFKTNVYCEIAKVKADTKTYGIRALPMHIQLELRLRANRLTQEVMRAIDDYRFPPGELK